MQILSAKFHTEDGSALKITTEAGEEIVSSGDALLRGDLQSWLADGGRIAPYLTILAAQFSNLDGTAVEILTAEAGHVSVTQSHGKADRYKALQTWIAAGGTVAAYVAPPPPPPTRNAVAELDSLRAELRAKGVL